MVRAFRHTLDDVVVRRDLADRWSNEIGQVRQKLVETSGVDVALSEALWRYFEGVCFAWALEETSALAQLRDEISSLIGRTLATFAADEVRIHSTCSSFSRAGAGSDVAVLRRYAELLSTRPRGGVDDRDPHAYRGVLLDGMVALVLGEDGAAQAASVRLHEQLEHPRTPPSVYFGGLPHAIDAVARLDQAALDDAADFTTQRFVRQVAATRDTPAVPMSALYPELSLVCRAASWRGMRWPVSPYVLSVPDPPSIQPRTSAGSRP